MFCVVCSLLMFFFEKYSRMSLVMALYVSFHFVSPCCRGGEGGALSTVVFYVLLSCYLDDFCMSDISLREVGLMHTLSQHYHATVMGPRFCFWVCRLTLLLTKVWNVESNPGPTDHTPRMYQLEFRQYTWHVPRNGQELCGSNEQHYGPGLNTGKRFINKYPELNYYYVETLVEGYAVTSVLSVILLPVT